MASHIPFDPDFDQPTQSPQASNGKLSPKYSFGLGFAIGLGGLAVLVIVYFLLT